MGSKKLGVIFDKWVGLTDFNMEISKKKKIVCPQGQCVKVKKSGETRVRERDI